MRCKYAYTKSKKWKKGGEKRGAFLKRVKKRKVITYRTSSQVRQGLDCVADTRGAVKGRGREQLKRDVLKIGRVFQTPQNWFFSFGGARRQHPRHIEDGRRGTKKKKNHWGKNSFWFKVSLVFF